VKERKILMRPTEMNAASSKVLPPEPSPLAAWHSYFQQNPTTYWVKERKILKRPTELNAVSSKYCRLSHPIGCMTFLFPTKPYYLLGESSENIKQENGNECSQYKSSAAGALLFLYGLHSFPSACLIFSVGLHRSAFQYYHRG
jgi:hypothetical protein